MKKDIRKYALLIFIPLAIGVSMFIVGGVTGGFVWSTIGFAIAGGGSFMVIATVAALSIADELKNRSVNVMTDASGSPVTTNENCTFWRCEALACRRLELVDDDGRAFVVYKIKLDINGRTTFAYSERSYGFRESVGVYYDALHDLAVITAFRPTVSVLNEYREKVYNYRSAEMGKIEKRLDAALRRFNAQGKDALAAELTEKTDALYDEYDDVLYCSGGAARFDEFIAKFDETVAYYETAKVSETVEKAFTEPQPTSAPETTEPATVDTETVEIVTEPVQPTEIVTELNTKPVSTLEPIPEKTPEAPSIGESNAPARAATHRAEIKYKGIKKK